ncbi:ATP-binding protein [Leptolyngbya sp. FACHB-17]|uniref:ATP-binding protein n=1 Tax=unclassified Leptolyngbya TaxID=2650499 RepID=UPI001680F7B8|nr:ATP-binding protein [Leptolyngbya sp. FACHB-17]MBD2079688.1 PAS domain-containing protein [Leptolyngbya sp. FACHB-17]
MSHASPFPAKIDLHNLQRSENSSIEPPLKQILETGPGVIFQLLSHSDGSITLPFISPNCILVFERPFTEIQANVSQWLAQIEADDQATFHRTLTGATQTHQLWQWQGRWRLASGQIQLIQLIATSDSLTALGQLWNGILFVQPPVTGQDEPQSLQLAQAHSREPVLSCQTIEQPAQLLQTVIDETQDWIFVKDQQFRYLLVNQSYATAIGQTVQDMLGKDDLELGFPVDLVLGNPDQGIRGFRTDDQAALAGQRIHNSYDPATAADGTTRIFDTQKIPLSAEGEVFAVLGFCHDVTERITIEEKLKQQTAQLEQALRNLQSSQTQLIQSEKMSSLGQLVAGIAHEINNPVSFIHGNLTYLHDYVTEILTLLNLYQLHHPFPHPAVQRHLQATDFEFIHSDLPNLLNSMEIGTTRIREIVLSLRNFSRLDEADFKAVDLHEGLESTLLILQHRLKPSPQRPEILIVRDYAALPQIECRAGQINQVFMSLLSNAIDALEATAQPRITIRTSVVDDWVEIAIADNGMGVPEPIQQRIFDPFFTTKPVGKGTGMGMSISYQIIVEKHHGKLYCHSTPGQGAEFVVELPIRQSGVRQ